MSDEKFSRIVQDGLRKIGFFDLFASEKDAYRFCTQFFRVVGVRASDVRITRAHESG